MRDYKKEYQNRIKNKKEIRCFIDINTYNLLINKLNYDKLSISKWIKLCIYNYIYKEE